MRGSTRFLLVFHQLAQLSRLVFEFDELLVLVVHLLLVSVFLDLEFAEVSLSVLQLFVELSQFLLYVAVFP